MDDDDDDDKRWSFQEEISKLFNASLKVSFPDFEEEALIYGSQRGKPGDYNCQNVLTLWPQIRKRPDELREKYSHIQESRHIGEDIKKNLPTYVIDMIDEEHSVQDVGFVPLSLSRRWLLESINMMLKDGIKTWAPKLPLERVVVVFPKLHEERCVGLFRREAIRDMLLNMLKYSKVATDISLPNFEVQELDKCGKGILSNLFSIEDRVTEVVISGDETLPFILTEEDFSTACIELGALRGGTQMQTTDWIVYVSPVRQQEYVEMCFTAAKREGWIVTDRVVKWNPSLKNEYPVATYAGYRTCSIEEEELYILLCQVRDRCNFVAQGPDAKFLEYSAEAVFDCVLLYTCLKNHRLADCTFNLNEMVEEEGNTFVYLLHCRAEIHRIIEGPPDDVALDLILETYEEWEEGEERLLEFHLLEFTEVLEESCLSVLPHLICKYLYDLTKKFKGYNDFVSKAGCGAETSKLLLIEATAVVMDKCFHLLGITPEIICGAAEQLLVKLRFSNIRVLSPVAEKVGVEPDKKKQKMVDIEQTAETLPKWFITPSFVSGARDPVRNSRFELFSIRPLITEDHGFGMGKLFGLISVSDKYGLRSDGGSHLFEPDFPYVHLLNVEWCHPINVRNGRVVYLGNPSSDRSVPFSSSMEIRMELYITTERKKKKKRACYQLFNSKFTMDLSDIWGKTQNSKCGSLTFDGEDGTTVMYYISMKDAIDAAIEIEFIKGKHGRVHGDIFAYYGGKFSYEYDNGGSKGCYMALLFGSDLEDGTLMLKRSELAVPKGASLIIEADLADLDTNEEVLTGCYEFTQDSIGEGTIVGDEGTTCSLILKVSWKI